MDEYNYTTPTIDEEKKRIEKIIAYLEKNNIDNENLNKFRDRYITICRYLNAKERYINISSSIEKYHNKLNKLNKQNYEYEVDNILMEDTLLNKFHEDTNNIYRNILVENIRKEKEDIRDILYLVFSKESEYTPLIIKRNRLREKLNEKKYPLTVKCMNEQSVQIEKEDVLQDEILLLQNNIKIEEDRLKAVEESVLTDDILKLLYEFCIISTYNVNRVDRSKLFMDNRSLQNIKENV